MSEKIHDDGNEQLEVKPTPGKRLRIAREALGLKLVDIAIQLKLDVEKIEALENDQVDIVVAPVFLLGYVRAYARLLGLSADELITEIEQLGKMTSPSLKLAARSAPSHLEKVSDKLPAHMTLANKGWSGIVIGALLILAVLMVGSLWWNSQQNIQSGGALSGTADAQQATHEISPQALADDKAAAVPAPKMLASKMSEAETTKAKIPQQKSVLLSQGKPADPDGHAEMPGLEPVNENTREHNDLGFNVGETALLTTAPSAATVLPDSSLSVTEPTLKTVAKLALVPVKKDELTFFFSDDSWVDVTDAMGQRLLYRLGKFGDSVTVSGVAPFNVSLGYLPGVRIFLNDDPYSLSRFGNRRIVRFQLDVDKHKQDNG